ncbi:MAG: Gldg family protein [Paludibacter sp.]
MLFLSFISSGSILLPINDTAFSYQSKSLMSSIGNPLEVTVYLDGELNPGFLRLKKSTAELLDELSVYSTKAINVTYINPSLADSPEERDRKYNELASRGLTPTAVYERDKEGKSIQKVIFPWIEISYNGRKVAVCLLKNILGNSGDENLNISIENLEFEITDGIRRVVNTEVKKIAFIEGHGELSERETYDICKSLSRYFQIDRGVLGNDASILKDYKAIIIAKPTQPFSESDKFIIDQYIMNGGNVLWLIDGVRIAKENLSTIGLSPAMELDVNLSDQLFRYGIRINPVLLQDVQCVSVPVNIAPKNATPQFEPSPWYYAPLLLTSPEHTVTRNITGGSF